MIIYKIYIIYYIRYSIPSHQIYRIYKFTDRFYEHLFSLCDNQEKPIKPISRNVSIVVLYWNNHQIFLILSTLYPLLSHLPSSWKGQYLDSGSQVLLKLKVSIWGSLVRIQYTKWRNLALEGVIEVIHFTFCIFDLDVMRVRYNPFVGIDIFYLGIQIQMLSRRCAV